LTHFIEMTRRETRTFVQEFNVHREIRTPDPIQKTYIILQSNSILARLVLHGERLLHVHRSVGLRRSRRSRQEDTLRQIGALRVHSHSISGGGVAAGLLSGDDTTGRRLVLLLLLEIAVQLVHCAVQETAAGAVVGQVGVVWK
jgi:hypothetical protein